MIFVLSYLLIAQDRAFARLVEKIFMINTNDYLGLRLITRINLKKE